VRGGIVEQERHADRFVLYRSKSLNMTQDLWLSLSVAEQQDFIDELESKIRLYETFHNDVANWVRFGDADAGDALYRVPLSTLP
ncbi:hypothetical protein ACLBV4_08965, partial [Pseudomonas aeruginosa]|uniref:hypothetical protein n=1 Tax=Pseudomonas aeruginosa TaxID=287 RepID=UPI00396968A7